jgi:hypothetical protein
MRRLIWSFVFCVVCSGLLAQSNYQVRYDYDASGNANFMADNYSDVPVYVALNFSYLDYASFMGELPYIARIDPGTHSLFTIYREPGQPGPQFHIEVQWYPSHPSPETDPEFPYLLPAKAGTMVACSSVVDSRNERSVGFEMEGSGEVCASRKGVVIRVVEHNDPTGPMENQPMNRLQVLHADGTVGEYVHFAFRGITCQPGQTVIPGEIMGRVAPLPNGKFFVGFSLSHSRLNSEIPKFLIPEFYLGESGVSQVESGKTYRSVHDTKIIKKELTGKERRALKGKK